VVVPDGGHGFEGLRGADCADRLLDQLVERGTARGLDTSCVAAIERPPFLTELATGEVALTAEGRARLLGRYEGEGLVIDIEPAGERLRLSLVGERSFLLVPRSPWRFTLDGLPPSYAVEVIETDGKVTGLRVFGVGDEPVVVEKRP
jgi:hypothetical protein